MVDYQHRFGPLVVHRQHKRKIVSSEPPWVPTTTSTLNCNTHSQWAALDDIMTVKAHFVHTDLPQYMANSYNNSVSVEQHILTRLIGANFGSQVQVAELLKRSCCGALVLHERGKIKGSYLFWRTTKREQVSHSVSLDRRVYSPHCNAVIWGICALQRDAGRTWLKVHNLQSLTFSFKQVPLSRKEKKIPNTCFFRGVEVSPSSVSCACQPSFRLLCSPSSHARQRLN